MADIFGAASRGWRQGREMKRQNSEDELNQAVKYAQLKEAGYDIQPTQGRGLFGSGGGYMLTQDPNFISTKSLERTKLQNENELSQMKLGRLKGGQTFGGGASGVPSNMKVKEYDEYGLPKSYEPSDKLSASEEIQKAKRTQEIYDAVEQNKIKRQQLKDAELALPNTPAGLGGKFKVEWAKRFNPNDPMLSDWQKIKSIGTDAQLLNTARTKGAISDKEMALFATAAANDDLISAPRLKPILAKLEASIAADESAKFGAYQRNYGEDPRKWFGQGVSNQENGVNQSNDSLEEEAKQAIANGADPDMVMERLNQMRANRG